MFSHICQNISDQANATLRVLKLNLSMQHSCVQWEFCQFLPCFKIQSTLRLHHFCKQKKYIYEIFNSTWWKVLFSAQRTLWFWGVKGAGKAGLWSSMLHEILRTLGQSWKSVSCVCCLNSRCQSPYKKLFITRDSQQENLTRKILHLGVCKVVPLPGHHLQSRTFLCPLKALSEVHSSNYYWLFCFGSHSASSCFSCSAAQKKDSRFIWQKRENKCQLGSVAR